MLILKFKESPCHAKEANVFARQAPIGFGRRIRINALDAHQDGPYTQTVAIITHRLQLRGVEPTLYVITLAAI